MSAELAREDLVMVRTFDAPPAVLFALWSEPRHLHRWMGPHGWECPEAEVDFRVGGAYRVLIRSAEHGDSWFGGVYREIEPQRRLVFTFAWDKGPSAGVETVITLTFEGRDGRTVQTFHQAPFLDVERRDSHARGWSEAFEREGAYAATLEQERQR